MIFTHLIFTMVFTTVDGEEIPNNHLGFITPFTFRGETTNLNWLAGFLPSTVFHLHPPNSMEILMEIPQVEPHRGDFFLFLLIETRRFPAKFPESLQIFRTRGQLSKLWSSHATHPCLGEFGRWLLEKTAGGNDQFGSSVWKFGDLFFYPSICREGWRFVSFTHFYPHANSQTCFLTIN